MTETAVDSAMVLNLDKYIGCHTCSITCILIMAFGYWSFIAWEAGTVAIPAPTR